MNIINRIAQVGIGFAVIAFLALIVVTAPTAQAAGCTAIGTSYNLTPAMPVVNLNQIALKATPGGSIRQQVWKFERSDDNGGSWSHIVTSNARTFTDRNYASDDTLYRLTLVGGSSTCGVLVYDPPPAGGAPVPTHLSF